MKKILFSLICLFAVHAAQALEVVATTASMGMLAREVGGAQVRVVELIAPDRDAHTVQARPSMMRALRDADLLVAVGADLEIGWLPPAVSGAANARIQPGKPGWFEAALQISLLDVGQAADRALGDVHPAGNPHFQLDPQRMALVGKALGERMAQLDPAGAAGYRQRAAAFAAAVEQRVAGWRQRAAGAPGALLHHRDGNYLLAFVGRPVLGYIEPIPGVPPTASHLAQLVERLKGVQGVILRTAYQPAAGAERLSAALGWPIRVLSLEPAAGGGAAAYFALIDAWVAALSVK